MAPLDDALASIIDFANCPIDDPVFTQKCADDLARDGVLLLPNFLHDNVIADLVTEAEAHRDQAYYTASTHNVYLTPPRDDLVADHPFNRQVTSSKGCITTDQIPPASDLQTLYASDAFKAFIASIVGEAALYEYGDPLSGINVHFAGDGQELGWHFDNSKFAITLLLQKPLAGGDFEYVRDLRDADNGEMNYDGVSALLDGKLTPQFLDMQPGGLVLFRGRNSVHRVTPTIGDQTCILVVLACNAEPGMALSRSARMTFFGRLG